MTATQLVDRREVVSAEAFIELVIWRLPKPVPPSAHRFKYRLAYVVSGQCVVRYDNERGKGDHRHYGSSEVEYSFRGIETLIDDFKVDIEVWNNENRHSRR